MRTARFSWVLLPLILATVSPNVPSVNAAESVSLEPESTPRDTSLDRYRVVGVIHLREGDSIAVSYLGPWALNAVRYRSPDGKLGYLSTHKIQRVVDGTGADVTDAVLEERKALSDPGGLAPPATASWLAYPFRYRSTRGRAHTITEFSALTPDGLGGEEGDGAIFSAGIGGMAALSPSWALGGVVHMATGDDDYRALDVGVRARRYFTSRASVDLTAGVFSAGSDHWSTRGVPWFGEAAFTFADALSLIGRVESATWEAKFYRGTFSGFDYVEVRREATKWRAGIRLGPSPRWLSIPAFTAGLVAFWTMPGRDLY